MKRKWEIQTHKNSWISLGFHIDHTDPSITIHLPYFVIYIGNCIQPGFKKIKQEVIQNLLTTQEINKRD